MYLTGIEDRMQKYCLKFEIFDFFGGIVDQVREIPLCSKREFPAPDPRPLRKNRKSQTGDNIFAFGLQFLLDTC